MATWVTRHLDPYPGHEAGVLHYTEGLPTAFGCPDLVILFDLPDGVAETVFERLVWAARAGHPLGDGRYFSNVLDGLSVKLVTSVVRGREVLRVILPDPMGRLEPGEQAYPWSLQYEPEIDASLN